MWVECTDNDGFEDQFTVGKKYWVHRVKNNSYHMAGDSSRGAAWYGTVHFKMGY